ncbi:MAG: hypothetical protein KKB51_15260 [Candidatus Riflebacteria bacterium]|nr:hypothetical protein [Candidatus Riflebacteria bacterium]
MRSFLILIVVFTLNSSQLFGCDVNIFSLFSGTSPNDEFSRRTTEIAQVLKNLGQNFSSSEKSAPIIKELMQKWIEFSNKYGQFPPEWAKSDQRWRDKFADLANIIGEIHKKHISDPMQTHIDAIKLSRRLSFLYEYMPMNELASFLMKFPANFDHLWTSYYEQNDELLKTSVEQILKHSEALPDQLPDGMRSLARNFVFSVEELQRIARSDRPFNSTTLYLSLSAAETEFAAINQKLANLSVTEE